MNFKNTLLETGIISFISYLSLDSWVLRKPKAYFSERDPVFVTLPSKFQYNFFQTRPNFVHRRNFKPWETPAVHWNTVVLPNGEVS